MTLVRKWRQLSFPALALSALAGCAVHQPFSPRISDDTNWRLSAGCRTYQYGLLTDPDCDILTGRGIAIQITRIRPLNLPPGHENRATIGIGFEPEQGDWYLASPEVTLETSGGRYTSPDIDLALVSKKAGQLTSPERLAANQQRYELVRGEQRFFRLRFAVPQTELSNGFALSLTGLYKDGARVVVPLITFN